MYLVQHNLIFNIFQDAKFSKPFRCDMLKDVYI